MNNKNKSKFWLETNSYFGYVSFGDDSDKNIISFNDAKNILKEQQNDDIFKARAIVEMNNDKPNFGFKSEHTGITLREWIDKYKASKKVFSLDEEYYCDDIEYILDNYESGPIYKADEVKKFHSDFIKIDPIIEDIKNSAYDSFGEYTEGYLNDLDKEQLNNVLLDYMNKNVKQPRFFGVENVREINIEEFRKAYSSNVDVTKGKR